MGKRTLAAEVEDDLYDYAKTLGRGNISKGVRAALRESKQRSTVRYTREELLRGLSKQRDETRT